jgi:hypothetical protein
MIGKEDQFIRQPFSYRRASECRARGCDVPVKKRAPGAPKAKDRDGLYKRRGYWHFDFKDPDTGKWRSKTTEKTNYNDAKEFKARFTENLGTGKYSPSNDRIRFVDAAESYIRTAKYRLPTALSVWRKSGCEH